MHRIRLVGPWEFQWLTGDAVPTPRGRVRMPRRWGDLFGTACGTARFVRRFGQPSGLEPDERVRLVFEGIGGSARIELNGRELGRVKPPGRSAAFDVTGQLRPRNELRVTVTVDATSADAGLWGVVAILIDTPEPDRRPI